MRGSTRADRALLPWRQGDEDPPATVGQRAAQQDLREPLLWGAPLRVTQRLPHAYTPPRTPLLSAARLGLVMEAKQLPGQDPVQCPWEPSGHVPHPPARVPETPGCGRARRPLSTQDAPPARLSSSPRPGPAPAAEEPGIPRGRGLSWMLGRPFTFLGPPALRGALPPALGSPPLLIPASRPPPHSATSADGLGSTWKVKGICRPCRRLPALQTSKRIRSCEQGSPHTPHPSPVEKGRGGGSVTALPPPDSWPAPGLPTCLALPVTPSTPDPLPQGRAPIEGASTAEAQAAPGQVPALPLESLSYLLSLCLSVLVWTMGATRLAWRLLGEWTSSSMLFH